MQILLLINWMNKWMIDWLIDWLIDGMIVWLIGKFYYRIFSLFLLFFYLILIFEPLVFFPAFDYMIDWLNSWIEKRNLWFIVDFPWSFNYVTFHLWMHIIDRSRRNQWWITDWLSVQSDCVTVYHFLFVPSCPLLLDHPVLGIETEVLGRFTCVRNQNENTTSSSVWDPDMYNYQKLWHHSSLND